MKLDIVKTIIAMAASALIAYGMYTWCVSDKEVILSVSSFVEIAILLTAALGLKVDYLRSMANIKIVSWIFFIVVLIMNIIFSRNDFSTPAFIISNGCTILLFVLIVYSLIKANKNK